MPMVLEGRLKGTGSEKKGEGEKILMGPLPTRREQGCLCKWFKGGKGQDHVARNLVKCPSLNNASHRVSELVCFPC